MELGLAQVRRRFMRHGGNTRWCAQAIVRVKELDVMHLLRTGLLQVFLR